LALAKPTRGRGKARRRPAEVEVIHVRIIIIIMTIIAAALPYSLDKVLMTVRVVAEGARDQLRHRCRTTPIACAMSVTTKIGCMGAGVAPA
jgi:hypothetical protein